MNKTRAKKLRSDFIANWVKTHPTDEDDKSLKRAWRQYKKQWKREKGNQS